MVKKPKRFEIQENTVYKIKKVGIKKGPDFEYYIDAEGDVSAKDLNGGNIKLRKTHIKRIPELYYFIDDEGDISAVKGKQEMIKELREEERNVARIFELAGFKVTHRALVKGVNIDIFAEKDSVKVICECKFENSEQSVRASIRQWVDKNKVVCANHIIIAIFGLEALGEDRQMAEQSNVIIWQEDNVKDYLDALVKNKEEGTKKLMGELQLSVYCDPNVTYEKSVDF